MIKGWPPHSVVGNTPCTTTTEIQVVNNGRWLSAKDLGDEGKSIWGERIINLTGRDDVERLRIAFAMDVPLDRIDSCYDPTKATEYFEFGVRLWNKSARRREFRRGTVESRKKGKKLLLECRLPELRLNVDDFGGEIEIEPLVVTSPDRVLDARTGITLGRGSVIAWAEPTVITLERAQRGLNALFDIRFVDFKNPPAGLTPPVGTFFHVQWQSRPVLWLDSGVERLQELLLSTSKAGRSTQANVRRAVNSIVAHQVLSTSLAAALHDARVAHQHNPDVDGEELLGSLENAASASILKGWISALGGDPSMRPGEQVIALLQLEPNELAHRIAEALPAGLQAELGTRSAVDRLLGAMLTAPDQGAEAS